MHSTPNSILATKRDTRRAIAVFVALAVLYPLIFDGSYARGLGIAAGAMAAGTVGFVLLMGYAHQLALGQAAFCLIGGYASAILTTRHGWDPLLALSVGAILSMVLAFVVGVPILRLRGYVLAMASLALQLILIYVALELSFTGGALGIHGIPKFSALGVPLGEDLAFYYFVWLLVLGAVAVGLNIDRSRIGRALKAIAASEQAAAAAGIDITRYKVQMFVVSAGMASISGSLTVHFLRVMEPHVFGFIYSLNLVTAVIAGGLMSIWGGVLGATIITSLREALRFLSLPLWESLLMGALTVIVLIAFPRGFAGLIGTLYGRLTRHANEPAMAGNAYSPMPFMTTRSSEGALLSVEGASRSFGSLRAVSGMSFSITEGSITALIGPNGAGKTTMFNLVSGFQPLDSGTIRFFGRDISRLPPDRIASLGVTRTFQNLQLFDNMSALDNVSCGRHRLQRSGLMAIAAGLPGVAREEDETRSASLAQLEFVGLSGIAAQPPGSLSFGHQRLLEIARAMALQPKLLLMDEPASGLNDTETEKLARIILRIRAQGTTILLVEHDIRLVMGLADHIVVMHHGEKIAEGPPEAVRADVGVIAAYLGGKAD